MTRELLRDKSLDWLERAFNGPYLKGFCWAAIVVATVYFVPPVVRILARL